jgi:hypothetical protein
VRDNAVFLANSVTLEEVDYGRCGNVFQNGGNVPHLGKHFFTQIEIFWEPNAVSPYIKGVLDGMTD